MKLMDGGSKVAEELKPVEGTHQMLMDVLQERQKHQDKMSELNYIETIEVSDFLSQWG